MQSFQQQKIHKNESRKVWKKINRKNTYKTSRKV